MLALALVGWADVRTISSICGQQVDAELLPAACDALQARHDALRLVTIAVRLRDLDTIRVAARELVRHTMASLPVQRARALLAAAAQGAPGRLVAAVLVRR